MKQTVEKRNPRGAVDHIALALTTWGVGYIPGAPGTYGSAVAVAIYLGISNIAATFPQMSSPSGGALVTAGIAILLGLFCLAGIWASTRSVPLLGNSDAPEAVVDELMGQFITFLFIPFGVGWPFILAGFLLFRLFDIWKPYPIDDLQILPGGLGVCADDIVAGVYAGICLAVLYAVYLAI
jgi:phosphatidylglycerophosphatase A